MENTEVAKTDEQYILSYTSLIKGSDVLQALKEQSEELITIVSALPEEKGLYRYAENKWSIKQLLVHMIDTERIMSYRAMCISRRENQPLPGYDENSYAASMDFNKRSFESVLAEYKGLRQANIALFSSLDENSLNRTGIANGKSISVKTIIALLTGHEAHHINILKSRYLNQ
jgi:uncharacterized damage-inducible protein DinB